MNDHLKRIRRFQSLHIWGKLIKKKSQQIVHTFSHLLERAGVLSNLGDEAINPGEWRHWDRNVFLQIVAFDKLLLNYYRAASTLSWGDTGSLLAGKTQT
jgi:hypothetical protein